MTDNLPAAQDDDNLDLLTQTQPVIPIESIIEYRNKGLTYKEIGVLLGCSKQNIHERLQPFIHTDSFKKNRADILAGYQSQLLNSLTPSEIKKIPPGSRLTGFGILYDKERLERDKSTSNVKVDAAYYDRSLQAIDKELEELEVEVGYLDAEYEDV